MNRRAGVAFVAVLALVALSGCAGLGADTATPVDAGSGDGPGTADGAVADPGGTLAPGTNTAAAGEGIDVTVTRVVDGDTVDVRYPNGSTDTVRLLGVDTPEVYGGTSPAEFEGVPETEAGRECLSEAADAASAFAERTLADREVTLVVDPAADRRGDYGRLLAYIHVDGVDFNYRLLTRGHARVYDSTFARSDRYYAAESASQDAGTGLWTCRDPAGDAGDDGAVATDAATGLALVEIRADAPGNDNENLNEEFLVFRNDGAATLTLGDWTVSDAADHVYTFPDGFSLAPDATVTLRTGSGEDTAETLYWGRDGAVWNNGGDTVTVARDGEVVLRATYG
jgi:micrococcal nuclease